MEENKIRLTGSYFNPYDEKFVLLPDGNGLVHQEYKSLLEQHRLCTLRTVFQYCHGHALHKPGLGYRERIRVILEDTNGSQVILYLKRFNKPGLWKLLKCLISWRNRAEAGVHDFLSACKLAEKGVAVARPIAYGHKLNWLGKKRSFAIIEELPQADALERLLPKWSEKKNEYSLLRNKKGLIKQMAQLVRQLHQSGYNHRDLYLSHVFLSKDKNCQERLNLIDLQRAFQPIIFKRRWKVKDLAQLYYSSKDYFSRTDMIRFLHEYFACHRLTGKQKRLIRSVYRKARRIGRREYHKMQRLSGARNRRIN